MRPPRSLRDLRVLLSLGCQITDIGFTQLNDEQRRLVATAAGVPRDSVYDVTMYVLAAMLVGGFVCNYLVKPLSEKWFMKDEDVTALQAKLQATSATTGSMGIGAWRLDTASVLAWLAIGIPIAWGVWTTLSSAFVLFR